MEPLEAIDRIVEKIRARGPGAALTGAGISAESGIMTYRDPGGLWDAYPEGSAGGMLGVLAAYPHKAPDILRGFFDKLRASLPNPGHLALARMEEAGHLGAVITQNVDDLHRRAGSRTVCELHGNVYRLRCTACGKKTRPETEAFFAMADLLVARVKAFSLADITGVLPRCRCGGTMRPDFVGFGEPVQDLPRALDAARSCGFLLVCGTSGVVHPAASIPGHAKKHGAYLVEVNPRRSELTSLMDDFVEGTAAAVLPLIQEKLGGPEASGPA